MNVSNEKRLSRNFVKEENVFIPFLFVVMVERPYCTVDESRPYSTEKLHCGCDCEVRASDWDCSMLRHSTNWLTECIGLVWIGLDWTGTGCCICLNVWFDCVAFALSLPYTWGFPFLYQHNTDSKFSFSYCWRWTFFPFSLRRRLTQWPFMLLLRGWLTQGGFSVLVFVLKFDWWWWWWCGNVRDEWKQKDNEKICVGVGETSSYVLMGIKIVLLLLDAINWFNYLTVIWNI